MSDKVKGTLVIIGGSEDRKHKCLILKRFVELAGGEKARLAVVTAATSKPHTSGELYRGIFQELGVEDVAVLKVDTRQDARAPGAGEILEQTTGIFFTGGDQLRLTSILGGTQVDDALHTAYRKGTIIAGTSAGASAMSDTMIVEGEETEAPRKNTVQMAPGLGLLREVVVDQHFAQRGRLGRLLAAVAQYPYVLGLGIDEDTAIIISPDGIFEVIGSQTVTVIDGKQIQETNVSSASPDDPLALINVIMHILPTGYRFDMRKRDPSGKTYNPDTY
ncbi:MAG TPA: cyanophycinase [Syntrophomonadaceae bacterium]|nr:cyanophycinase [Syntrophomonadaceae bacterium]